MASLEEWMKFAPKDEAVPTYDPIAIEERIQTIAASLEQDNVKEIHAKLPDALRLEFN